MDIRRGGRQSKLTPQLRHKLHRLFDAGLTIEKSREKLGKRLSVSRAVVGRVHKTWARNRQQPSAPAAVDAPSVVATVPEQLQLLDANPAPEIESFAGETTPESAADCAAGADVPGSGGGTKVMTKLSQLADIAGVVIYTWPSGRRVERFYELFGFIPTWRSIEMVRYPAVKDG